jgi:hypothetical protein
VKNLDACLNACLNPACILCCKASLLRFCCLRSLSKSTDVYFKFPFTIDLLPIIHISFQLYNVSLIALYQFPDPNLITNYHKNLAFYIIEPARFNPLSSSAGICHSHGLDNQKENDPRIDILLSHPIPKQQTPDRRMVFLLLRIPARHQWL